MYFVPAPAGGRSGSCITNKDGKIVGLLRVRTQDNREGGAVALDVLRSRMRLAMKEAKATFTPDEQLAVVVQCGPGGCPPQGESEDRFFGRRRQAPPISGGNPWPTLPVPSTPPLDINPLVEAIRESKPTAVVQSGPDPATTQALQSLGATVGQHGQAIQQIQADVPKMIDASVKPLAEQVTKIDESTKLLQKAHAKLVEDAEAGGLKGKLAQKLLDMENGGGDDQLRKILITAGIVLGAVFLIAIAVLHTMRTGKGPAHDIVEKLAAKHPDNERLAALHEKLEKLDSKIAGAGQAAIAAGGPVGKAVAGAMEVGERLQSLEDKIHQIALALPSPSSATINVQPPK
jgi:hypothetical protein